MMPNSQAGEDVMRTPPRPSRALMAEPQVLFWPLLSQLLTQRPRCVSRSLARCARGVAVGQIVFFFVTTCLFFFQLFPAND
jgi:hypothetical protein